MADSIALNCDCIEYMRTLPDNAFDLAVVDPPYGGAGKDFKRDDNSRFGGLFDKYGRDITDTPELGIHFHGRGRSKRYAEIIECARTGGRDKRYNADDKVNINRWDVAPPQEYFDELFRVSKNQIIFGGNYFELPATRCFIVWRKLTISEGFSMAMCEYAWTSFNDNAKYFEYPPQGKQGDERFHPTQKPIELYNFVFKHFAKDGDRILDTHLGSGSSRISAYNLNLDFVGTEINEVYFRKQEERFERMTAQQNLFIGGDD